MMEKLLIVGIGSLTGYRFSQIIQNDFNIFGTYYNRNPKLDFINSMKLNILDFNQLEELILKIKPDIIVNFTAMNNVDYCETHEDEAYKVNSSFVKFISTIANKINSKLIHTSTDSVFDGKQKESYKETDLENPPNIYGISKLQGEKFVLENSKNLVIRASVLYGWLPEYIASKKSSSMKSTNFAQWLIEQLKLKNKVKIITDEFSSPIIADDFAQSINHLIKSKKSGLYHSAPIFQLSRYDFSKKLATFLDLDDSLIIPVTTKELGRKIKTGQNKCLNSTKLQSSGYRFLDLDDSFNLIKSHMLS